MEHQRPARDYFGCGLSIDHVTVGFMVYGHIDIMIYTYMIYTLSWMASLNGYLGGCHLGGIVT